MQFNEAPQLEPVGSSTVETDGPRVLSEDDRKAIVDSYAALRAGTPGFRTRRAQSEMIGACARALGNDGGAAIIEAGTGTGKSLAYLTAATTLGAKHELTVVIATGTVSLQEQLANRDIPHFLAATKIDGGFAIAKGRGRYACPRNMSLLTASHGDQSTMSFGIDDDLAEAGSWPRPPAKGEPEKVLDLFQRISAGTWDGDLDNPPVPIDDSLKPLLTTTSGGCSQRRCAFNRICPYFIARKALENSSVVITNHALLVSDLELPRDGDETFGGFLLPPLQDVLLVVDEGHHLAKTAVEASSASVHASSLVRRAPKWQGFIRAAFRATKREVISRCGVEDAMSLVDQFVLDLRVLVDAVQASWTPDPADGVYAQYRAPLGVLPPAWQAAAKNVSDSASELLRVARGIRRALVEEDEMLDAGAKAVLPREIGLMCERMDEVAKLLAWWSQDERPSNAPPVAKWVRVAGNDMALVLCASPVSAAGFIRDRIFDQAAGVVVTSATISAGGDFRKVTGELGFPRHGETLSLQSPFDYERQGVIEVPWISAPASDHEGHAKEIARWIKDHLDPAAGNLVLFTSKSKMSRVHQLLDPTWTSLVRMQGTMAKAALLEAHTTAVRSGKGSTLFGLQTLGEGIDLAGDLCTTVVITALPFKVPTDPVDATYAEWLESRGRRPFDEIAVPGAIRTLTQYVGRLLRHEDDTGRVVILDRRIVDKTYGRRILAALPPFRHEIENKPGR
ncbi:ATP-dependent DNA helicase DinG [Luteimonas sp. MHLX1A]|uniref:ATP-dependent DNA helicase DinG n=1 Tax=Alterluteimonas muca TaxID=2878684 RepID=UPI001E316E4F|nr:ATP-dependent DNA helicase DinG [Luteimonas sp. MHLX1A]MCD9046748.1 ATP-dependent DNA helicase DinG [Luteimonas sp. MHLX1A]